MTTLIDRGVGGTGMDPSTIKLGTFFSYALGTNNDFFNKKSPRPGVRKVIKLFIAVKSLGFFPRST